MDSGFTFPSELFDSEFAEKEAKWAKAAAPYDNLSQLPPKYTNNYYVKRTSKGPECVRSVHTYFDPWPVKKKEKALSQDKHITAGIATDDREAFNQELSEFEREHNSDKSMDISEVVAAKNRRISQVQKAMLSGQGPAAAEAQEEALRLQSPQPAINHYNTRSRRAKTATATQNAQVAEAATATGATEILEKSTLASGATTEKPCRRTPILPQILMRNTRGLSVDHTKLSRPVRGVISNSYYTSNAQASSSRSATAGHEPEEARSAADEQDVSPQNEQTGQELVERMQEENIAADSNMTGQSHLSKADGKKKATSTGAAKDAGEPKPRRALKACDNCRKHKTRCNGGKPCEACERRKFTCIYAPGEKKAPGKQPKKLEPDSDTDNDADHDTRPAKRARKQEAPASKTKESAQAKQPTKSTNGNVPSAKRAREESAVVETQPAKWQRSARGQVKGTLEQNEEVDASQPTQLVPQRRSTRGQGKRVRKESEVIETQAAPAKQQRSDLGQATGAHEQVDEVEAKLPEPVQHDGPIESAKPQSSKNRPGKRTHEDDEDTEDRPAKQQRKDPYIPWHELYHVVDKDAGEDDEHLKTFLFEDRNMNNKGDVINWMEQEDSFHNRPSIRLVMPDLLKAILVDDWEHVTKDQQLVPIPHEHPVDKLLKDYLEDEKAKREEGSTQMDVLEEIIAGLREYFDRTLGRILLYR